MNISAKFDSFFFLLLFFFQLIHFFFIYFFSILIISRLGRFGLMLSRNGNFKYCKLKKKFTVFFFKCHPNTKDISQNSIPHQFQLKRRFTPKWIFIIKQVAPVNYQWFLLKKIFFFVFVLHSPIHFFFLVSLRVI